MTQLVSEFNGVVLNKPSHLTDKEWAVTTRGLKESHGGRLFSSHEHKEPAKNSFGVPASDSIEFAADKAKREKRVKPVEQEINVVE